MLLGRRHKYIGHTISMLASLRFLFPFKLCLLSLPFFSQFAGGPLGCQTRLLGVAWPEAVHRLSDSVLTKPWYAKHRFLLLQPHHYDDLQGVGGYLVELLQ